MKFIFAGYSFIHFCLLIWAFRLWQRDQAPGALYLSILAAGLWYDNGIISIGGAIGLGSMLETLSWPRFILHAIVTPFLLIATMNIAKAADVEWAKTKLWQGVVWVATIAMVIYGVVWDLLPLQLQPACFGDIVRYTSSASPAQFCFEGQVQNPGVGPPIPSIVADILIIIVGAFILKLHRWPWMLVGGVLMFIAAAIPMSRFGLVPGNGGEVILTATLIMTSARFALRRT